jgi:hypothetical protein
MLIVKHQKVIMISEVMSRGTTKVVPREKVEKRQ